METSELRQQLLEGLAIPALPLALDDQRQWSHPHQRAVLRYYIDAGVGGIAVGVHSTQFEIREPQYALFEPLLKFASEEIDLWTKGGERKVLKIAGLCGTTEQAINEASIAVSNGYDAGLLSLTALNQADTEGLLEHCREIAEFIPVIGFYLQSTLGKMVLPYDFWYGFAQIPNVVAIKIAPFNRYQTFDVVRAVMDAGRDDLALYTGNDDNIIADLLTPWEINGQRRFIVGGLLGQFGVWTKKAVELLEEIKLARQAKEISADWLTKNAALTDANAAVFDPANQFKGVLTGIHEVLRRQGLFSTIHCLDPNTKLSPGQSEELDRVCDAYPWLVDDDFVQKNRDRWFRD